MGGAVRAPFHLVPILAPAQSKRFLYRDVTGHQRCKCVPQVGLCEQLLALGFQLSPRVITSLITQPCHCGRELGDIAPSLCDAG